MPTIQLDSSMLEIKLGRFESYLAKTKSFKVDFWRVKEVKTLDLSKRSNLGLQVAGRGKFTGVFMVRRNRDFVYWPKGTAAVEILVVHPHWNRIVLCVSDAEGDVIRIRDAVKALQG